MESARAWSLAAALSHSHVTTFLRRSDEAEGPVDMERGSVEALAKAANVNPVWLLTGVGLPSGEPTAIVPTTRTYAISLGYPEKIVDDVLKRAARGGYGKLDEIEILSQIKAESKLAKANVPPPAHPSTDDIEEAARKPRKRR